MASLTHLLVLLLAATAVLAKPKRSGREGMREQSIRWQLRTLKDNCLPPDVDVSGVLGDCKGRGNQEEFLECVATGAGFTGSSGYDEEAAKAFVDQLSENATWTADQKEALDVCADTADDIPTEQQGSFVLICWIKMQLIECNKQRLVAEVEILEVDGGKDVAEKVANMAEGFCLKCGLQYSDEIKKTWEDCADDAGLNKTVFIGAGMYYRKFTRGNKKPPQFTAENVTAVAEQLAKVKTAVDCYTKTSGEFSSGTINYDKMLSIIEEATGNEDMKAAAKELVEYCQDQEPSTVEEFHTCYFEHQPYACAVLKARDFVTGSESSKCPDRP